MNISDLLPGDVLLYESYGFVGRLIQAIDGTPVSHASLCLGGGVVGEAIPRGLSRTPIEESIAHATRVFVRRHTVAQVVPAPVLAVAEKYLAVGGRYSYEQFFLMARILRLRREDLSDPTKRAFVEAEIERADRWVESLAGSGREPMICSEFVYRCFDEVVPDYHLEIDLQRAPRAAMEEKKLPANWVTPADLLITPSLFSVGELVI